MEHNYSCRLSVKKYVMKRALFFSLLFFAFSSSSNAQVFWTENFNNGCPSDCDAATYVGPNGPWTSSTGPGHLGFAPNIWYVSCAENGHTPTICGSGCAPASATATLATLHVGSTTIGDIGAAFDAGGCFGGCTDSDIRSESPTINTVGKTTITLAFNYIANGDPGNDYGYVEYSTNNGATWNTLTTPAVTPICPSTQGKWTAFSMVLPASCDNIATLKIAYHWINNDDGLGSDPSFALDDMTLSTPASNSITTGTITGSPFCACSSVSVPFTSTGTFTAGNVYTAQLSDAAGSFAAPVTLGTLVSTANAGTIAGTIPCGTPTGSGYRIRVISSTPAIIGTDNGVNITITQPSVATFSYTGTPYCASAADPSPTFSGGGVAGTFTSAAGLVFISAATGQVDLSASTPGTYTVTNTITATGGCPAVTATSSITINAVQSAAFSYSSSTFCNTGANPVPTITGTAGGTFSASPAGLSFVSTSTGEINAGSTTLGTYTVTYTTPGPCPGTATASVTITSNPIATFGYTGSPYCQTAADPSPTFSGGGTAGAFSSTAGLVFVSTATGQVDLSASTPGTYTVTNTIAASGGCPAATATATITIEAPPDATFSYAGPYCTTGTDPSPTLTGTAGTFTSTAGLSINSSTGIVDLSASTAGTYTVTNTVAGSGACPTGTSTATITINDPPVATFSYAGPYCQNDPDPAPSFSGGGVAGTFSSTAGLVINAATGQVTLASSTAGTYTVTNSIPASGGCAAASATATITINAAPTVTVNSAVICSGQSATLTAAGATSYSWSAGVTGSGATVTASPASTTSYTVTGTAAGCTASAVAVVTVNTCNPPVANFAANQTVFCSTPACVNFSDLSTNSPTSWSWSFPGSSTPSSTSQNPTNICYPANGNYDVTLIVSNANGSDTLTMTGYIQVGVPVTVTITGNTTINACEETTLYASPADGTYSWGPTTGLGCSNCSATTVNPPQTTDYYVTYTSPAGCTDSDTITVVVTQNFTYYMPTAFSPNGDGINDVIQVHGKGIDYINLKIYDRIGEKVFDTTDPDKAWDGKLLGIPMNDGVFVYRLEVTFCNGDTAKEHGSIILAK
ncbi:MAG: gliding motility-associated C-terminal domain-containing protein [Bacteroidia bacterium]